ncbi:MAG: hypothetical protein JWP38_796 [Herbaspirillum sp.]|jgi:peptidoglycan/LPS O-acetylase OafA/YrhL|nr:hypothetical protein [Herbaspirillum sp.]
MKHIRELDGLRAVAVLSVLFFHVGFDWAGGGFIGVDVFFVISGFLITGILLGDIEKQRLSLGRFYMRRVLRIAPALFVTLIVTAAVFFVLLPPSMSQPLPKALLASVLSYSNIWFYYTVDYFSDNHNIPVLHTWSLAVEEQFYLFFPLLLLLAKDTWLLRHRVLVFSVLGLLSFIAACVVVQRAPLQAFYLPWLRAWELLAGALLTCIRPGQLPDWCKRALSNAGLIAILAGSYYYSGKTPFPGYSALVPVLGAAAIIAGVQSDSLANRVLRLRFMTWTGKISYSLYLVHWPLVCAGALMAALSPTISLLVVAVSFILAWLSWRFVETPFRNRAGTASVRKTLTGFGTISATLLFYFVAMQFAGGRFWDGHPKAMKYFDPAIVTTDFFRKGSCFVTEPSGGFAAYDKQLCLTPSATRKNVLLIGDSHAANLWKALSDKRPDLNVMQATAAGCRPTLDAKGSPDCTRLFDYIYREWLPANANKVSAVVMAAMWQSEDIDLLDPTIALLKQDHVHVVLYGPSPEYLIGVPLLLAYEDMLGVDLQSNFVKRDRAPMDNVFRTRFGDKVSYFSPFDHFCINGRCRLEHNGVPSYIDRDHLTYDGVSIMLAKFPLP